MIEVNVDLKTFQGKSFQGKAFQGKAFQDKTFQDKTVPVIENLHFSVAPGEFLAVIGPSGAGKTTLLNLICGLDTDFSGRITRTESSDGEPIRFGYLFQEPRLMPWLTVLENVELVARRRGKSRRACLDTLAAVGMADCANYYPKQLSGGMQRRVALARAFLADPEFLLMDEPFISLDFTAAEHLRELLLELWNRSRPTVIYVTHDLAEALCLADRVLILSKDPARLLKDRKISLPRPRTRTDNGVLQLQRELARLHPELFAGTSTRKSSADGHIRAVGE